MAQIVVDVNTSGRDHISISLATPKEVGGAEKLAVSNLVKILGSHTDPGPLPKISKLTAENAE